MITVIDKFLPEQFVDRLYELCTGELLQLDSNGAHVNEYTEYEWQMIKTTIRTAPERYYLLARIGDIIRLPLPTENLEPMQLFAKKFDENSFIDPHREDPTIYGEWVWMLYLTDETDGHLIVPGMSILPRRNRLVVMNTGQIHSVDPCSGPRLNLSGWPFATKQVRALWKKQPKQ